LKLGKLDYISDPRTLKLSEYFQSVPLATTYDTDAYRRPYPDNAWGNDQYADSILAARANAQLRLARIEQNRTIPMTAESVVGLYKKITGCKKPGDKKDTGLAYLPAMQQWKDEGWKIGARNYKIAAFGELDPLAHDQLKFGCYILTGVHFGFSLPIAVKSGDWIFEKSRQPEWKAGSWGGMAAFGYAYNFYGFYVKAWGKSLFVDWAFIDKYCDEAWAVIPSLESDRVKQTLDVEKLAATLQHLQRKDGDSQIKN